MSPGGIGKAKIAKGWKLEKKGSERDCCISPGTTRPIDQKRKGIYYDVGDEKAKDAAVTMLKNFRDEEVRKNAGDESS